MGTAYMQMISKPNRKHSTKRYSSSSYYSSVGKSDKEKEKGKQEDKKDTKEKENKEEQENSYVLLHINEPPINPSFSLYRCGITYKAQPTNKEYDIVSALIHIAEITQNRGLHLSSVVFDRDMSTGEPIFSITSKIGEHVDIKVKRNSNNEIDFKQMFEGTTPRKNCDKVFLKQIYTSLFTNKDIKTRVRIIQVNKEGNQIVSYVCTNGVMNTLASKDAVLYWIERNQIVNAMKVVQNNKANVVVTE